MTRIENEEKIKSYIQKYVSHPKLDRFVAEFVLPETDDFWSENHGNLIIVAEGKDWQAPDYLYFSVEEQLGKILERLWNEYGINEKTLISILEDYWASELNVLDTMLDADLQNEGFAVKYWYPRSQ